MMRLLPLFLPLLLLFSSLRAFSAPLLLDRPPCLKISLEHALTDEQKTWGLMQRRSLPEHSGMTFTHTHPQFLNCWMFNCWIDLSLAFLDPGKVIREIRTLKAYPHRMDPKRPVLSPKDLRKYPFNDPITQFFLSKAAVSSFPAQYLVEMNAGWFSRNGVSEGDVILWNDSESDGVVIPTLDLSPYAKEAPLLLTFNTEEPLSVAAPTAETALELTFLDAADEVIAKGRLKPREKSSTGFPQVLYTDKPVKALLIGK